MHMERGSLGIFIGVVVGAAALSLGLQDWAGILEIPSESLIGDGVLIILGLISEGTALRLALGRGTTMSSTIFLPLIACVLLFGPSLTVLFFLVNGLVAQFFFHRKETRKAVFNVSQYVLCAAVAGFAFEMAGGEGLAIASAATPEVGFDPQVLPFAVFGLVYLPLNNALVFTAITLSSPGRGREQREAPLAVAEQEGLLLRPDVALEPLLRDVRHVERVALVVDEREVQFDRRERGEEHPERQPGVHEPQPPGRVFDCCRSRSRA
jgi:hypothetical protein